MDIVHGILRHKCNSFNTALLRLCVILSWLYCFDPETYVVNYKKEVKNEPLHDKTNKETISPAKTQISLGIQPVWSESSLCAQWVAKDPTFLHADSEDSDQTGRMPRLICLHWAHTHFVGFVMSRPVLTLLLIVDLFLVFIFIEKTFNHCMLICSFFLFWTKFTLDFFSLFHTFAYWTAPFTRGIRQHSSRAACTRHNGAHNVPRGCACAILK